MNKKLYTVTVKDTDISFPCEKDEDVFTAMIRNRKGPLRYGCYGGGCGVCKMKIVKGKWYAYKPMSAAHVTKADIKNGLVLLCCVKPKSNLLISWD